MPSIFTLRDSILIHAPIERCFALSTSVEIVQQELHLKPVAGRTKGLVALNDTVRWQGWKLGFWQYHVSLIDGFGPPHFFRDRMIEGRFRSFEHEHFFEVTPEGTMLRDELRFSLPFGVPGRLVARWILLPHIRNLMRRRFLNLKRIAESQEWKQYLWATE